MDYCFTLNSRWNWKAYITILLPSSHDDCFKDHPNYFLSFSFHLISCGLNFELWFILSFLLFLIGWVFSNSVGKKMQSFFHYQRRNRKRKEARKWVNVQLQLPRDLKISRFAKRKWSFLSEFHSFYCHYRTSLFFSIHISICHLCSFF